MNENQEKINRLSEYIQGLMNDEDRKLLYDKIGFGVGFGVRHFFQKGVIV